MLQLSSDIIAYIFGAIFGIASVIYFAKDVFKKLSLTSRIVWILLISVVLCISSLALGGNLSIILLIIGGASYAISLYSISTWYNIEKLARFVLFGFSSILFVALGIVELSLSINKAGYISLTLLVASIGLSAYDILSEGIEYRVVLYDNMRDDKIGELSIENKGKLRRKFNLPNFVGELCQTESRVTVKPVTHNKDYPSLGKDESLTLSIKVIKQELNQKVRDSTMDKNDYRSAQIQSLEHNSNEFTVSENETVKLGIGEP
jgi:hypothetical protein